MAIRTSLADQKKKNALGTTSSAIDQRNIIGRNTEAYLNMKQAEDDADSVFAGIGTPSAAELERQKAKSVTPEAQPLSPEDRLRGRQDLMKGILAQQKAGTFGAEAREGAEKAASALGVTSDQFSKGLERAGVETGTGAAPLTKSQATQNVMFARAFGSGLDANAAMQNPNYEIGSGSALRQAPRQIGTASGAMRREARRLRKEGYAAQAGEMAGLASKTKLAEGSSITRPSDLAGQTMQRMQAGQEALEQEQFKKKYADYASRVMDYRMGLMDREEKKRNPEIKYG